MNQTGFPPGTLWSRIGDATQQALASGALQSIRTRAEIVVEEGISFVVRVVDNLARKEQQRRFNELRGEGRPTNPFLPYDEKLFVAAATPSHLCLLNKFNVVEHHLLIVTREFEDQETPLTKADFHALLRCLDEIDGLAFYNGGAAAGASQPHKHLQLIPLPFGSPPDSSDEAHAHANQVASRSSISNSHQVPLEAAFQDGVEVPSPPTAIAPETATRISDFNVCPSLPYRHLLASRMAWPSERPSISGVSLEGHRERDERKEAERTQRWFSVYQAMLDVLDLRPEQGRLPPYNLLATRRWIMMVPRSHEYFDSISLNALAYAGGLLVRNTEQLELLCEVGPLAALKHAGVAPLDTHHPEKHSS